MSLAALALVIIGCKEAPETERRWIACNCEYLTDFDYPGHVAVDICSSDREPQGAAVTCAQSTGAGVVNGCTCKTPGAACAKNDACRLTDSAGKR